MNRLMLTPQAAAGLSAMTCGESCFVRQCLSRLQSNPSLGLKLWGHEDLYVYETATGSRVVYRLTGAEVQVLAIESAGPFEEIQSQQRISGVVLAAGHTAYASSLSFSSLAENFLSGGVDDLIVVVGDHAEQAKAELSHKNVTVVVNTDYGEGLSKSLRYGLRMVPGGANAVMLSLGNRPFISREVVACLIKAYRDCSASVVLPAYSQMRGHPVIFNARLLPELLKTRGNAGGREVLKHHIKEITQVDVGDAGVLERTWLN